MSKVRRGAGSQDHVLREFDSSMKSEGNMQLHNQIERSKARLEAYAATAEKYKNVVHMSPAAVAAGIVK